jgi:transcriptional regulator with XRE-family HTH domain
MSIQDLEQTRREELGKFLRDRRAKVQPSTVGINPRRRRRARGLLREEVAELAGVSVTWYTWLEQARPTNPSARTLEGLTQALCLDAVERAHLFRLARPDLNPNAGANAEETLSPALLSLLQGLAPHPAYAIDARWDILAWNRPAEIVFGGFAQLRPTERNVLHRLLFDSCWQTLFVDCDSIVAGAVAQFRATTAHLSANASVKRLVTELTAKSERFKQLWEAQNVAQSQALRKTLRHASAGLLAFDYATLRPDGTPPGVRFTIYTPADAATVERMRALLASVDGGASKDS